MYTSEYADEYGDWLSGFRSPPSGHARFLECTLGEMQHETPACVGPETPVSEVIALMNREQRTAVLVVERDELLGIFTERDVLMRVVSQPDSLRRPVRELMTPEPHTLPESTMLGSALRTLALGSYHHLPVVDARGVPRALVSLQSIIAFLAETFPEQIMNAPPQGEAYPAEPDGA